MTQTGLLLYDSYLSLRIHRMRPSCRGFQLRFARQQASAGCTAEWPKHLVATELRKSWKIMENPPINGGFSWILHIFDDWRLNFWVLVVTNVETAKL